jgi:hypothetical protein
MKHQFVLAISLFLSGSSLVRSQDTSSDNRSSKWDLSLEGMVGASVGKNFYSMNVGGPALFLVLNKDWKVGIGALPSIYLLENRLGARLGVSPRIDFKNLVFIAPFFYRDKTESWVWSVGLGYKFHRKK